PTPSSLWCASAMRALSWLVPLALAGCTAVEERPAPRAVAALDEATFRTCVEPPLVRRCSYNACHGKPEMAFRLYSLGKLRAVETPTLDSTLAPLTEEEH